MKSMMTYNKWIGLLLVITGFSASSCKKFVEIQPAPNLIETNALFSSDKTALSAVYGVYTQLRATNLSINNGGLSVYAGLYSDEISYTGASPDVDQFFQNSLLADNSAVFSNFWNASYRTLYQVNAILDGLQRSSAISDSVKKQITGEMKVVRSLYYFNLVNIFGSVPLVLTTDYQVNSILPRAPVDDIYRQMITDLTDALGLLKTSYPTAGKVRINKWTAATLLARIYLFKGDWTNAEAQASAVINSGLYNLATNLNSVFLINSVETIWEVPAENINSAEGAFVPSSATVKPAYPLTTSLYGSFEPGDLRKTNWIKTNTISGQPYNYPYKYKARTTATPVSEYEVMFRLAELFLIRAEARAQLNDITGSQADLNRIRNRAGLANSTVASQTPLLDSIYKERRVELFCEWGHRWFDLKRTGRADAVLSVAKAANWQSTDALWPLPTQELETNVYLTQNPGYRFIAKKPGVPSNN
jgi:hypothetical protein